MGLKGVLISEVFGDVGDKIVARQIRLTSLLWGGCLKALISNTSDLATIRRQLLVPAN